MRYLYTFSVFAKNNHVVKKGWVLLFYNPGSIESKREIHIDTTHVGWFLFHIISLKVSYKLKGKFLTFTYKGLLKYVSLRKEVVLGQSHLKEKWYL